MADCSAELGFRAKKVALLLHPQLPEQNRYTIRKLLSLLRPGFPASCPAVVSTRRTGSTLRPSERGDEL
jgi:hypothetical protein